MDVRVTNLTLCPVAQPNLSENYVHFRQLVNGFLTTLCVCLGTFGNLHSIKSVHFANFDKNRGIVLAVSILALAMWDTLLLWCAFFYYGFQNLTRTPQSDFINLTTPYMHGFSQIANTASIWCVVSITVQRYLATRDPFRTTRWLLHITSAEIKEHHRVLLSSFRGDRRKSSLSLLYCTMYRRHFKLPILISLISIIINVPAFFELKTVPCLRLIENRIGYMLRISPLRLNAQYKLYYKVIFRMIVTTCGPNICILLLTIRTVMLLKGSNRSRKNLFQMSESLIDRYSSKATMLTLISIMLVVKFLTFRSLSFMLDIWEQAVGFGDRIHTIIYLVDTSNFLILLNSATNCFIIFRFSKWLQKKIVQRNTMKREKQICVETNCFNSTERINLIHKSWQQLLFVTHHQVGARILYAMVLANPQVFALFREVSRASQTGTPVNLNYNQFRPSRERKVVRIASSRMETISITDAENSNVSTLERVRTKDLNVPGKTSSCVNFAPHRTIIPSRCSDSIQTRSDDEASVTESCCRVPNGNSILRSSRHARDSVSSEANLDETVKSENMPQTIVNPALVRVAGTDSPRRTRSTPKDKDPLIDLDSSEFDIAENIFEGHVDIDKISSGIFDEAGNYIDRSSIGITENHVYDLTSGKSTRDDTPPGDQAPSPEQLRRMSVELVSNKMFREIGDRITKFLGEIIEEMYGGQSEQHVLSRIRVIGNLHYDKGIYIPPTAWRDFKMAIMSMLGQCEFTTQHEQTVVIDAWSSFIAIFIREMKLSMLGKTEHNLNHKHSTSVTPANERSTTGNGASSNFLGRMD